MTPSYKELCQFVCDVARSTGKFMAEERTCFDVSRIETKGLHDLVSYVDKESEKRIISALQIVLPESGFIAEEGTSDKHGDRFNCCLLYTSPSPRDGLLSRMPSSA